MALKDKTSDFTPKQAPDFLLLDDSGNELSLKDFSDKYLL